MASGPVGGTAASRRDEGIAEDAFVVDGEVFRGLVDAAPALIAVTRGPDHVFVYANSRFMDAVGGRPLLGRPLRDALPELAEQGLHERFDEVYATGTSARISEGSAALYLAGSSPLSSRSYRRVIQPWRGADGSVQGVTSVAFDVTDVLAARYAAEASGQHLALALEAAGAIGTFNWEIGQDVLHVDDAFARIFDVPPDTARQGLPLQFFIERLHDDDRDRVLTAIETARLTSDFYEEEYRVPRGDGSVTWVIARGRYAQNAAGVPEHFWGVVIDNTERRRAAAERMESEARLRSIFSAIDEGFCLAEIIVDEDGQPVDYRFLEVNALFETMTGLADAAGRTIHELVPDIEHHWVETYGRVALGGETMRFESQSEVLDRWFDVFATPVEPKGRFALVFKDITAAKKAEAAVRESEARFRNMADHAPTIVWMTDPTGFCTYLNRRWYALTGQTEAEAEGFGWLDATHPDDKEEAGRIFLDANARQAPFDIEYRLRTAEGVYRWAIDAASPRHDEDGTFLGYIGSVIDIHDRKTAEERQTLMVRELHHRVKNTLATVQSVIGFTLRTSPDMETFRDGIGNRIRALARSHTLLTDNAWAGMRLEDIVRAELEPYDDGRRIVLGGPNVDLPSDFAVPLAMAIHELTTNAVKYGALSVEAGSVEVTWSTSREAGGTRLDLIWIETGGPEVVPPTHRGFGTTLLERLLGGQVKGNAAISYPAEGAQVRISALVTDPAASSAG